MRTVVVTDIFGRTEALDELCEQFSSDFHIVDPYSGCYRGFESEADAYNCFMSECGIDAYSLKIESAIASQAQQVNLLGFSVGISAI